MSSFINSSITFVCERGIYLRTLRNIRYEVSLLAVSRVRFFITVCTALVIGVFTWLSCDGISFVWKTSLHPSFCLPLSVMFCLCALTYIVFGCLIILGYTCSLGTEICIKATVAYFAFLFWCPLTLLAGVGICGLCAVAISAIYLVYLIKIFWHTSLLGTLLCASLVVFFIYLFYFTVGFTIIN